MSRWPFRLILLATSVAVVLLTFETRRLAEQVGVAERAAHDAAQRARDVAADAERAQVALDDYARLQLELHESREQISRLEGLLRQRNAELAARAERAREQNAKWLRPIPEGVRLCLVTLHECLRDEGYLGQRFLRADALDEQGLHGVEMIETSEDGLAVAFFSAGRMTATVDRQLGRLELRFFDGHRTADGERRQLPEEGYAVTFDEVDGRVLEARLPFLVKGEGRYPSEIVDGVERLPSDVDPATRRQWLRRINRLLGKARTAYRWRLTRLQGMQDAAFLTVELIATDEHGIVHAGASCARLEVEVDERAGLVSLLLHDGVLRQPGGESTISSEGHRMLLPGTEPKETIDAMLGMVVKR